MRHQYQVAERWHGWEGERPLVVCKLYLPLAGFGVNRYGCSVYYGLGAAGDAAWRAARR